MVYVHHGQHGHGYQRHPKTWPVVNSDTGLATGPNMKSQGFGVLVTGCYRNQLPTIVFGGKISVNEPHVYRFVLIHSFTVYSCSCQDHVLNHVASGKKTWSFRGYTWLTWLCFLSPSTQLWCLSHVGDIVFLGKKTYRKPRFQPWMA